MRFRFGPNTASAAARPRCRPDETPASSSAELPSVARARRLLALCLLGAGLASFGCKREDAPAKKKPPESAAQATQAAPAVTKESAVEVPLINQAASCTLGQSGLVLDLGDEIADARRSFSLVRQSPPTLTTREGESYRRLDAMGTDFVFWLTEDLTDFEFSAKVYGLTSERLSVSVDGQRLGAAGLKNAQAQVVTINAQKRHLVPGRHTLTLGLSRPRGGAPEADVSWLRLGPRDKKTEGDLPATRRETFSEVTIGEERLRSVVLRPNSSVRCSVWVPEGTELVAKAGIWGEGPGEVEIVVHTTQGERFVLARQAREEDETRDFRPIVADLRRFSSQFVDIELFAPRALRRARIVVGEPRLRTRQVATQSAPRARRALVVVLSGLGQKHAPPAAAAHGLPLFNQIAQQGAYFSDYRATSTSVLSVMATLLTGLPPYVHGIQKPNEALSHESPTLASSIEGGGGRTAFFSSVPLTFEAHGMGRGFGTFDSYAPQADVASTAPILELKKWLQKHIAHEGPVLGVLHLRGGHPPFDVTREAAQELPPAEYGGNLTPRRAAIQLAEIRARQSERHRQMPEEDWRRLAALQKRALLDQNVQLTHLFDWLKREGAYDDTLIVLMGDVSSGEVPLIPFAHDAPLEESFLAAPLIVKFPAGFAAGTAVPGFFAPEDVTMTLAASLGIEWPRGDAIDLSRSDAASRAAIRPHIAYRAGAYSLRLGDMILQGKDGTPPRLCQPALDVNCLVDRGEDHVLEGRALWFTLYGTLFEPLNNSRKAEVVPEDERHQSALLVWGIEP